MKSKPIASFFFMMVFFSVLAFAESDKVWRKGDALPKGGWVWPRLKEVFVYARADLDPEGQYNYSYAIDNSTKNVFALYRFEVDLRENPQEHPFTREHISLEHDMEAHWEILNKALRIQLLRVLRPEKWNRQFPAKWQQKYINDPVWTTTDGAYYYQLKPGENISGFGIVANAPPGIREFIVDAEVMEYFERMLVNPLPPEKAHLLKNLEELDVEVNKGVTYSSKTIAPVAPPEPFTISSWTARMGADATEARKLGWIKTDKNLAEIRKLIDGLKISNLDKLKTVVEKIAIYALSEKKQGNLTDEADALVRLNAQYLLRRLEKQEESVRADTMNVQTR